MPITVETCVASHIGDRREQQDRVGVFAHPRERGMLMAVLADGMGGHTGGAMAAEQVLLKARQNFDDYSPRSEDAGSLLNTIVNDAHLIIRLTRLTSEKEPHSTAVVLVLQPGEIRWAHCGDSRLYHFRDNRVVARSEDHSVVGDLQRKGQLNDAGARIHPRRNVLLSCLGSERPPEVCLGQAVQPQAGDSFLLCSDGLWGLLSDAEISAEVCSRRARDAAEVLVERARKRGAGAGDNISLALIKLVEAPASQS
ncbi:PP2C family protein-serine/threonine phosphatase [Aromatoleum evansii]|uniref:Protein phosphatase 2C domain-containing protein n=1 Tax=Aromatoleum evansii TaxID=59406 RepID=A0ABZ1AH28_AROEV|nr:protein phosphatase 2C domain-containing protein [Aromatoleum evansii]NMG30321.1 SpoIIE family protein phosphatase [Aromatoleum evansii]WRL45181.1 protein phosphatase 2C domain-containing protein [Aromatoleum evansii]